MIQQNRHAEVVELLIDSAPVNALGAAVRQGLASAIREASADPGVAAIVIRGRANLFSAGADIAEFGQVPASPGLSELLNAVEASDKPVIAAIHGMALGGGLELALSAHYRVAARGTRLGLPEVKLGLIPGAGGTQRLPRLIGAGPALEMIVSGEPITAERAHEIGLIDELAASEPAMIEAALALARSNPPVRRSRDLPVQGEADAIAGFEAANPRLVRGLDAPRACIQAVEAAIARDFDAGLALERQLFESLMAGDQSKALRHAFFAERTAAKVEGLPKDLPTRPVGKVGVIGAGTMGGGISMNFLSAGLPVTIVETNAEALERGVALVRKNYEASAAKGRLTGGQVEAAMALLTPTLDFGALADCDLVVEAVYENMEAKKEIFGRLDRTMKPGAILATNTSYLDVDEIASATGRPQDVLGLHFFSPANVMKLVEVVRGRQTAPDVIATAMALARRIGKAPVVAGVCYGFIGNRMLIPRQENATALLLEGATPDQVDRVHTRFGMPMGPFQMADLAGVDIGWHRDPSRVENLKDALCAAGRWGQKTQAGFYDYDERRKPAPSPVVEGVINDFRAKAGIAPRAISDEEITVRTLYTMVNEGAKILDEGIAQRASDIDVVWLYGYGWPRHTGGPMFWAETVGLGAIVEGLERFADRLGPGFTISPLLKRRAEQGGRLEA